MSATGQKEPTAFSQALDEYCSGLDFTSQQIAEVCGISAATLSRYRNGVRAPKADGEPMARISKGLADLYLAQQGPNAPSEQSIRDALESSLQGERVVGMNFNDRLDALMTLAGIKNAQLASALGVDPSYISRIRKGNRTPSHTRELAKEASRIAARTCLHNGFMNELASLIGFQDEERFGIHLSLDGESALSESTLQWLTESQMLETDLTALNDLLILLDTADWSKWVEIEHVDGQPRKDSSASPFARFYYGTRGMRTAETDFLEAAISARVPTLSLSSDMPLLQQSLDREFLKRYKKGLSTLLKQGCHINIVHSMERPFYETIRMLQLWAPLYMTGQVTPRYLVGVNNRLYFHTNYVCDACALSSEAVIGHQEDGRYYVTTRPADIAYYKKKMGFILEKSTSLLEIYRECEPGRREALERARGKLAKDGKGVRIGADRFSRLTVVVYPKRRAIISVPCGNTAVHFMIWHPTLLAALDHLR